MPIHDWTRVPAGLFHHFHQDWTIELARALNRGRLPKGIAALVEQRLGPRANRIVLRHHLGRIIAVIEVVSPGNKDCRASLREFVDKTVDYLRAGIHVLVVDLFPPTPRDPLGIHQAIWDEFVESTYAAAWDASPIELRTAVETGVMPEPAAEP